MARRTDVGRLIGLGFGLVWAIFGSSALPAAARGPATAACVLLFGWRMLAGRARDRAWAGGRSLFRTRAYVAAVAFELVAIAVAAQVLPRLGLQGYIFQAVAVIVGLHFIGLWAATRAPMFLGVVGGMCAAGLAGAALPTVGPAGLDPRGAVTGFGCALTLLVSAFGPAAPAPAPRG